MKNTPDKIDSSEEKLLISGIDVIFKDRVFWIHTPNDQLFDLVCSYLMTEGFFDRCIERYEDDWGIEQVY